MIDGDILGGGHQDNANKSGSSGFTSDEGRRLEAKCEKLKLVCQAMWEIMRDAGGVSEEILADKVREIDLRDGRADGINRNVAPNCHNCGRVIQRGKEICQYCGTPRRFESVFDVIM